MKILITDIFLRKTFDVVNILLQHYKKEDLLFLTDNLSLFTKLKCQLFYNSNNFFLLRKDDNFNADLSRIAANFEDEKLIFPPIEEDTIIAFYNYLNCEKNNKNIKYLLPEKNNFVLSRNKELLNLFCEKNEIPCPKLISKTNFNNNNFKFPIIVKPKEGSGSKGIIYIDNKQQLYSYSIDFNKSLVQERLPNPKNVEGGFYLCENGKILSFYSHKRIRTYPEKGGVTVFSEATNNEKIKLAGEKVIKQLNWNGLLMIEFIYDERDEKYKLIEINPRMWGSILLSEKCGANFIQNYIELTKGNPLKNYYFSKSYIRWIFPYDVLYFFKNTSNPLQFFKKDKDTCYINFSYTCFTKSLAFLLLSYFNFSKILQLFKK